MYKNGALMLCSGNGNDTATLKNILALSLKIK
jgi:hypothetical protein